MSETAARSRDGMRLDEAPIIEGFHWPDLRHQHRDKQNEQNGCDENYETGGMKSVAEENGRTLRKTWPDSDLSTTNSIQNDQDVNLGP